MTNLEHYWKFAESEQRFNDTQSGIRTLASGWLLAAAAAIGILLRSDAQAAWLIQRSMLVVLVCTLASAGFAILWVLDQLVFQRLLNAVFVVGLKLEKDDHSLPPIHAMMMLSAERKGMHRWLRFFYVVPMLAFLVVSIIVTLMPLGVVEAPSSPIPVAGLMVLSVVLVVVQLVSLAWLLTKQESVGFNERARAFGDAPFNEIVQTKAYDKIISRYERQSPQQENRVP